ncbi:hypothetical protein F4776DRAFT_616009 [Hypoxylon sp. NC0597]|nr:hypothetical protein F4776DRAFT_616009 [Hypoxylon sp. NC0597]
MPSLSRKRGWGRWKMPLSPCYAVVSVRFTFVARIIRTLCCTCLVGFADCLPDAVWACIEWAPATGHAEKIPSDSMAHGEIVTRKYRRGLQVEGISGIP